MYLITNIVIKSKKIRLISTLLLNVSGLYNALQPKTYLVVDVLILPTPKLFFSINPFSPLPCLLIFRKCSNQEIFFHKSRLLNFEKCSSQDVFKSRQEQKTLSIFLLKLFVTDYLSFKFSKSLHCSF